MTQRATLDSAPFPSRPVLGRADRHFGVEPPLSFGEKAPELDRRDVNLRWLGASVLTGLTGGALIGAAIYVSLQGEATFAELPERVVAAARGTSPSDERAANAARKADKLVRAQLVAGTKQTLKAPLTMKVADREVIRVRSVVRVASGLSLTTGVYATDIPAFDPSRLFTQDGGERGTEAAPDLPDAEVSVVKRDLGDLPMGVSAPALTDADVAAQIEEERRLSAEAGRRSSLPVAPQLMLTRTLGQPAAVPDRLGLGKTLDSPFNAIEVRVVPENVTSLGKIENRSESLFEDRDVGIKRGETFEATLRALGASPDRIRAIAGALGERARNGTLPEGQHMRVLLAPGAGPGDPRQIARVILFGEGGIEAIAAANDRGGFVSVAPPTEEASRKSAPAQEGEEDEEGGVRLYDSLYETVLKHDLPRQIADELVRVFGYDVDFQRRVAPGDSIELLGAYDEESGASDRIEVLSASLTVGGEARKVFRYQSPDDNSVEYFDDQGRSLKKFLIRKPISEGIMRSGFGYRRHPILGYAKLHTGVDWANKIGTPIMAAGNGTILKSEWDSGYGRRVEIQHPNGYVTAYNHMSRFGRGISPGARVRQGQVIGFVGSTGLSTGPHLHYEVIVNGHFVDPMKIRVPRGRELDGRALAEFKRQRDQAETLLQRVSATTRVASREKS